MVFIVGISGLTLLMLACARADDTEPADRGMVSQASRGLWRLGTKTPIIQAGDMRPRGLWNDPSVLKENDKYIMYMTTSVREPFSPPILPFRAVSDDGISWKLAPTEPVASEVGSGFVSIETPSVVKYKNIYHMYFTGIYENPDPSPMAIGHASSPDGVNWTVTKGPVIAATGKPQDWNGYLVGEPGAIVRGNQIFVYFSAVGARPGGNPPQIQVIGLAVTSDGEHFSAPSKVLEQSSLYPSSKGFVGYSTPSAFELNGRVHLLYDVALFHPDGDPEWQQVAIHHAVSTTDGRGSFVADPAPIFTRGDFPWTSGEILAPAVLVDDDGLIKLWFAGHVERKALGPLIRRGFAGGDFGIGLATRRITDFDPPPASSQPKAMRATTK